MNQQGIAPIAHRSLVLPFVVALVAAYAYGAAVTTTTLIASNLTQPSERRPRCADRP